jgi:hypothetical protein
MMRDERIANFRPYGLVTTLVVPPFIAGCPRCEAFVFDLHVSEDKCTHDENGYCGCDNPPLCFGHTAILHENPRGVCGDSAYYIHTALLRRRVIRYISPVENDLTKYQKGIKLN